MTVNVTDTAYKVRTRVNKRGECQWFAWFCNFCFSLGWGIQFLVSSYNVKYVQLILLGMYGIPLEFMSLGVCIICILVVLIVFNSGI